jgi:putative nucleotidyltransferase with HDIG domain
VEEVPSVTTAHDASPSPQLEGASQVIAAHLLEHFASPSYTPPMLPAVAVEVHTLAHKPNVDVPRVVAVLERDPMLAGRVLKVAQSAAYARDDPPKSLQEAVVRIGMRELSNLLWELTFSTRILRIPRYASLTEVVIQHSTRCARITRHLCSSLGVGEEYAFLCGLLHDVGITASLGVLAAHAEAAKGPLAMHVNVPQELISHSLRVCHEEATRRVVQLWKLPAEVQQAVGHHHSGLAEMPPLLASLIVAERLTIDLDEGGSWMSAGIDDTDPALVAAAQASLSISDERLGELREEARGIVAAGMEGAPPRPSRARATVRPQPQTAAKPKRRWYHFLFR